MENKESSQENQGLKLFKRLEKDTVPIEHNSHEYH